MGSSARARLGRAGGDHRGDDRAVGSPGPTGVRPSLLLGVVAVVAQVAAPGEVAALRAELVVPPMMWFAG